MQSWPTGFWPDGSVKWTAHAVGTEEFTDLWLQDCRLYNGTPEQQETEIGQPPGNLNLRRARSRLTACAAAKTGDAGLAARAWQDFYTGHAGYPRDLDYGPSGSNPQRS